MGANSSSMAELDTNSYLRQLSDSKPISLNDPFWNQLLSYTFVPPANGSDAKLLDEQTSTLVRNLSINNPRSGNLCTLVRTFICRAAQIRGLQIEADDGGNVVLLQTYNALFIIRSVLKALVENLTEELILEQIEAGVEAAAEVNGETQPNEEDPTVVEELCESLVITLIELAVSPATYGIHLECVNAILVLLSIQMYHSVAADQIAFYQIFMQGVAAPQAAALVHVLLNNYMVQMVPPSDFVRGGMDLQGGVLYSTATTLASTFWNVMTLGYGTKAAVDSRVNSSDSALSLANQSLLLLMVLSTHCANVRSIRNPYRNAMLTFGDSIGDNMLSRGLPPPPFRVSFEVLYRIACSRLPEDHTLLLLYLLLHRNAHFRAYIVSRAETLQDLVVPILQILYSSSQQSSHLIYMALIVLLMLTEASQFCKAVNDTHLKAIDLRWYSERHLGHDMSLSSLICLILIRTIQYNLVRMRDRYLHTNCLAALANLSTYIRAVHPYVAQRFVALLQHLSKKHGRLVEQIRLSAMKEAVKDCDATKTAPVELENSRISDAIGEACLQMEPEATPDELQSDLDVLEDVVRNVFEILNNIFTCVLTDNPHLVYTLLYQREVYSVFRTHPAFQDILQNIDMVVSHFTTKLDKDPQHDQLSESRVLAVILEASKFFRKERLKRFPEPKYKYVEEDSPDEFFIPYIWAVVYRSSGMFFSASRMTLLHSASAETAEASLSEVATL